MAVAIFGFVGVLHGSLTTSVLAVYRERLTTRREQDARDAQYERDRKTAHDTFQRDSILALQSAISDLIRAVYQEQDRVLAEFRQTGQWPARQWRRPQRPGDPTPCSASNSRAPACSMISCAPSPSSCAPWQATASGPRASMLPGSTRRHRAPAGPVQRGRHRHLALAVLNITVAVSR